MSPATVDPRVPRVGQGVTAAVALAGVTLQEPVLIYVLTLLLVVPVLSRWRIDPYGLLWKHGLRRVVSPPTETESPIPHRFARVLGAMMTSLASVSLLVSVWAGSSALVLLGFGLVAVVGVLASVSAVTGFCLGCRMYSHVALFRDWKLLTSPAEEKQARG